MTEELWMIAAAVASLATLAFVWYQSRLSQRRESENLDLLLQLMQEELKDLREENARLSSQNRTETLVALGEFSRSTSEMVSRLGDAQAARLSALEGATAARLEGMAGLIEGRQKALQATLQDFGQTTHQHMQSFKGEVEQRLSQALGQGLGQVNTHLAAVNQGLGEMRALAAQVADLKGALANVKTRGLWGERQLETLLSTFLSEGQFERQKKLGDGPERVDFAVRVPAERELWLPIDSKLPLEPFYRLKEASQKGDVPGLEKARKELRAALKTQALSVAEKYLRPPQTVDFALLFLPSEGLYAEALADEALVDELMARRVLFTGPNSLCALLSALQLGFRALALAARGGELWQALGHVRREFGKFHDALGRAQAQATTLSRGLEETGRRARAMERRLLDAEGLSQSEEQSLFEEEKERL